MPSPSAATRARVRTNPVIRETRVATAIALPVLMRRGCSTMRASFR
ncbi:hypothetical protein [Planotetraspora phitsanulokensis]|nr:hypothetical protein [Planotetraspora phitsanulokensis]